MSDTAAFIMKGNMSDTAVSTNMSDTAVSTIDEKCLILVGALSFYGKMPDYSSANFQFFSVLREFLDFFCLQRVPLSFFLIFCN